MTVTNACMIAVGATFAFVGMFLATSAKLNLPAAIRSTILRRVSCIRAGPRKSLCRSEAPRERRASIVREMPAFLDIVTLGLSAGLSFDASLELYCKRHQTTLSEVLWNTMQLWRIGAKGRSEALCDMARDENVASLQRFAATVSESLAFGTPLAQTLERQAQVIRDEQRSLMEEEIEKAPVKMLIPLGTLIVPAMLLAILGPLLGPALGVG